MAAAAAVPVPAAAVAEAQAAPAEGQQPAMGSLFDTYDPNGALEGMFAPAFIKGYAPSEAAVMKWNDANRHMTNSMIEQTRMPHEWRDPTVGTFTAFGEGQANYGAGRIPTNLQYGTGAVDPEALRVAAQGGHYDMQARRDAIAQRVLANTAAEEAYNKQKASNPFAALFGGFGGNGWKEWG